jgi:hypothetical protein
MHIPDRIRSMGPLAALGVTGLAAVLILVPALREISAARSELRRLELDIARLSVLEESAAPKAEPDSIEVPEAPDLAALMAAVAEARRAVPVRDYSFETMQNETRFLDEMLDSEGAPFEYLYSSVRLTFYADLRDAAAFLDRLDVHGSGGDVENLTISRRPGSGGTVYVQTMLNLYGIPR